MLQRLSAAWAAGRQAVARAEVHETLRQAATAAPEVAKAGPLAEARSSAAVAPGQLKPDPLVDRPSWALIHFGDARGLTERLAQHRAFCLTRGFRCLLIADDIPELCVTSREVTFEFLQWPGQTAQQVPGGHGAAVDHAVRRLGLALGFWQAVGCDWEGDRAELLLDLAPEWSHPVVLAARKGRRSPSQRV